MPEVLVPANPEIAAYGEVEKVHVSNLSRVFFLSGEEGLVAKEIFGATDKIAKTRFALESLALAYLDHPRIPSLVADETDRKRPFFVMGRLEHGERVHHLVDSADPEFAARVILSALEPIAHMHELGVINRDITTSNLAVADTAEAGLTDFGLIKPSGAGPAWPDEMKGLYDAHIRKREKRFTAGTADYMSPEQVSNHPLGVTTDIYSLGIVFYELLYGKRPYSEHADTGNNMISREAAEDMIVESVLASYLSYFKGKLLDNPEDHWIRMRHLYTEIDFTVPNEREIPGDLVEVVKKATQKHPHDRYQTAEEMHQDISMVLGLS